ncbi:MAG: mandelate racemase/muconate lactonizing enzyme family protein [Tannerellaceae bacterium]|jgi:L-alanine-DL-glutamate epimerase-like enolase superfamily enzyme|nr:mandelate racemase/muconate lactonizing enzyme family protein [Tannerellaceae bacterium]
MNSELKKIIEKDKPQATAENMPADESGRRSFLKKTALSGLALGGMMGASIEDTVAFTTQNVKRASSPSELKITDMRYAVVQNVGRTPIIRIDTNQGIYGLGEVRDSGDERYALLLKSRILGLNPCNVEMIFKIIRQFGYHGRQGGGVCAVEMALWDLCGKAYGVPAWQLLGGRYRDKIRCYADTASPSRPDFAERMKKITEEQGFTWLKMDLGIHLVGDRNNPGVVNNRIVNNKFWGGASNQYGFINRETGVIDYMGYVLREHPFTQVQLTDEGLDKLAEIVDTVRRTVGYEIPLSSDHYGHFDINNHIRMARKLEKYRLAWIEDVTQWWNFDDLRTIKNAVETPVCTGEDTFGLRGPGLSLGFKDIIDSKCVDIIHPDLATSGGLLETKRIGDYAQENGVAMAMHMAGTPICFMANVHCAAATENFLAMEHHSVDSPWWFDMVKMTGSQPIFEKGFAPVPLDSPGLGIELNEEVVKEHLIREDKSYFAPTPYWDNKNSNDRLWS